MVLYRYIKIYLIFFYYKIKKSFGFKFKIDKIPDGQYCYVFDGRTGIDKKSGYTWYGVKKCPYYKYVGKTTQACLYDGFIGFDFCLFDQCKICGIKDEINEKDLS